jgi:hypothetical protein
MIENTDRSMHCLFYVETHEMNHPAIYILHRPRIYISIYLGC